MCFPQIITYFKIRSSVLLYKICSLQVCKAQFSLGKQHFLCGILTAAFLRRGMPVRIQLQPFFYWPLITIC